MKFLDLFRRRRPEEGDDLDGCALDFTLEPNGPPVRFEPDPAPDDLGVSEPGAKGGDRGA